jgi:hypothetical protein
MSKGILKMQIKSFQRGKVLSLEAFVFGALAILDSGNDQSVHSIFESIVFLLLVSKATEPGGAFED